jgi:uncharacterized membrane protein
MHEDYVSRAAVVVMFLWVAAGALIIAVWIFALSGVPHVYQYAVGTTGMATLAVAITCQVRLYVVRLCALMRATTGLDSPDAELHTINGQRPR